MKAEACTEQLKQSGIKPFREELLEKQGGICPLCEEEIKPDEATLDHCYDTGHCRAVLHRSCNGAEGRILKWAGQMSRGKDHFLWLTNLVKYWDTDFTMNPLHPKHGKPKPKRKRKQGVKRKGTYTRKKSPRMKKSKDSRPKR